MDLQRIFHERQEQGSMLCAQHALNNLLQTSLFSAGELANIAQELDEMEAAHGLSEINQNADATGFFSVGVIEQALSIVNLKLVRWDSQDMRPYQSHPEEQQAFLLNLGQHWFIMRKFAQNSDLWFNLNSFLPAPARVSKLYLGLQIHEAQREGYSVFAVVPQADYYSPVEPFLPHCSADDYFVSNSHLSLTAYGSGDLKNSLRVNGLKSASSSSSGSRRRSASFDDLEDERPSRRRRISPNDDEEEMLRRAIEASMQEQPRLPTASASKEDEQLAEALRENLAGDLNSTKGGSTSTHSRAGTTDLEVDSGFEEYQDDAPTLEQLRMKRLARFQQ